MIRRLIATIIIVTFNRPECVRRALACLRRQEPRPTQIMLVDASTDDRTAAVALEYSEVEYVRPDIGYGHMTKSRNVGLRRAVGDVIVFIDDDAYPHDGWLAAMLAPYTDRSVGGVGGRALNKQPGEESDGIDRIGRLLHDGTLTGFFAADPGRPVEVDHLIGCNMSWRRSVLNELGGLRDDYPGTEVREETDLALRVRSLGYRLIFQPLAVVTHVGAPQAKGRRFDARYAYFASRNHAMLIVRNFGVWRAITWRNAVREVIDIGAEAIRRIGGGLVRGVVRFAGFVVGTIAGIRLAITERHNPRRNACPD